MKDPRPGPRRSRHRSRAAAPALLAPVLVVALACSAAASTLGPTVGGSVTGTGRRGDILSFRLVATEPTGFQNLATLQIALLLHSVILDEITYDRAQNAISTPTSLAIPVGSRFRAQGTFVQVAGRSVDITTSGDRLALTVRAQVVQNIPKGSVFSMAAIDSINLVRRITRDVSVPEASKKGFSWGDLALAIIIALFVGGFVGNLFSGRRPARPPVSVYDAMRERIEREKPSP